MGANSCIRIRWNDYFPESPLALQYRFEQGLPLRVGLKAFLKAA